MNRRSNAWQWNPPKRKQGSGALPAARDVQSSMECTGLMPQIPQSESEALALSQLYAIHTLKPHGNIGKGNPNNPPDEIAFHRQ